MSRFLLDLWDEAEAELLDAKEWYDAERPGLGDQLLSEVQKTLDALRTGPFRFPVVQGNLRRATVPRFPYSVIFRLRQDIIEVIAILHQARDPRHWQSRQR